MFTGPGRLRRIPRRSVMTNRLPPIVGNWYKNRDRGELFQVVAVDEDAGTIEVQDYEGGLDEIDDEEWRELPLNAAVPPDDWGGPVDDVNPDEFGYTDIELVASEESEPALTWEDIIEDDDLEGVEDRITPVRSHRPQPGVRRHHH
jgi:hypothetical protein